MAAFIYKNNTWVPVIGGAVIQYPDWATMQSQPGSIDNLYVTINDSAVFYWSAGQYHRIHDSSFVRVATFIALPAIGAEDNIYYTEDTNELWLWHLASASYQPLSHVVQYPNWATMQAQPGSPYVTYITQDDNRFYYWNAGQYHAAHDSSFQQVPTFASLPTGWAPDDNIYLVVDENQLYRWDSTTTSMKPVGGYLLVGAMVGWSDAIPLSAELLKYHRCDGAEVSQATYPDLYTIVGNTFGTAAAGNFKLPTISNMVIRMEK